MLGTQRRSGFSLIVVGLLGVGFFWMTDWRFGLASRFNHGDNAIDLANQHFPGTVVGIISSLLIFLIGLYLVTRKTL